MSISNTIAFIGAGNMAGSIIKGLLEQGTASTGIRACVKTQASAERVKRDFNCFTSQSISDSCAGADVIVLGVKPQGLKDVCLEIGQVLRAQGSKPLIISVAAGITCELMQNWLAADSDEIYSIVRAMPNTPSQLGLGATGAFATETVSGNERELADTILKAVGIVEWVNSEDLINPVTAVSGSGPAYYFLIMEAMIEAGIELGLSPENAKALTLQTALGAATLACESDLQPAELRRQVTSPGGTTEQAINSFEQADLRSIFKQAMRQASERGQELAELVANR